MPLPFKDKDVQFPNNMNAVYGRTKNTLQKLGRDDEKLKQCVDAMKKNIEARHVEEVPHDQRTPVRPGKCWWLPIFVVTQETKRKHRLVYDGSAKYHDTSLNSKLLQGPDQNNRLRGVLIRFRKGEIAFSGDICCMFYNFFLPEEDKDFLRFFWFKDNDPNQEIIQYRGCVHIFGCCSSPAVAHSGLMYATQHEDTSSMKEAIKFIKENIYVDDGLGSTRNAQEAVELLDKVRTMLQKYNIKFHKIASNSDDVLKYFPKEDRADVKEHAVGPNEHVHKTLGLAWNITNDRFVIKVNVTEKPFTRRGLLSTNNSVYDPIGIVNPVTLTGKLIQRKAMVQPDPNVKLDWDTPLSLELYEEWRNWVLSLSGLRQIQLPRSFIPQGFGEIKICEIHAFSDASELAIGSVVYLRLVDQSSRVQVSYVISSSRLTPKNVASMKRLELCAAVLTANLCKEVADELKWPIDATKLYTDSKVVIGYLRNEDKRFSKYVTRRVSSILKLTRVEDWSYISSELNPADTASRPQSVTSLLNTDWINGPTFLYECSALPVIQTGTVELPEVVNVSSVLETKKVACSSLDRLAQRISNLNGAIGSAKIVIAFSYMLLDKAKQKLNIPLAPRNTEITREEALMKLIYAAQESSFPEIFTILKNQVSTKHHRLASLDVFLDENGMLRVGGRLKDSSLHFSMKHPLLLPYQHPLTILIIQHHHRLIQHQGRHITLGAIRNMGYFVEHGSKMIRHIISKCVICKRLRGKPEEQMMASLPKSRLQETAPFSHTGADVCGPFYITDGKTTRQNVATKKIWCLLLTCMVSRAVHIEILNGLDTSSLINSLRRFFSIRGISYNLYSDQGTNFIGSTNESNSFISLEEVKSDMELRGCTWHFNPPHASLFGGAWERKIGILRRIFEASILKMRGRALSRDEICTLVCEAMSIINNTPYMWYCTSKPQDPLPISPAMILTLRDDPNPPPVDSFSLADIQAYGKRRWRRVQLLADVFWQKWRQHYLCNVQERSKWITKNRNIQIGDVVLMKNKAVERNRWPLAIVKHVKVSSDNLVRSVCLETVSNSKTEKRQYDRPISEIILLIPVEN